MIFSLDLPDEAATEALAAAFARRARRGDVIALQGGLGAGKTCFARAFIRALAGACEEVPSPTFTLLQIYEIPDGPAVWHFDLYRLKTAEEAFELGLEEGMSEGICLIEWPDRLGSLAPRGHLELRLEPGASEAARRARIQAPPSWVPRLQGLFA
ncbi:MAG TPA: tRNA (adenosine(37)-N6)-threonylcarbamoyltransferase complex ATPase subunit type 1 TsaE [Stellaceae bacterium]|nr:tRNA (adenosine(37)-N6)-threonylcarbamoyltransferase complex ATPase subunit type 1 TsaE [Stellaceae bacterium]